MYDERVTSTTAASGMYHGTNGTKGTCHVSRAHGERTSAECLCRATVARVGSPNDSAHAVWVAFLSIDNRQYDQETWGLDYVCLPTNRLTSLFSRSPFMHCQLLFWDEAAQHSRTYSVDASRRCVFTEGLKTFAVGWTFVRVDVTREQECAMRAFLDEQLGKPFSARAYGLFCVPASVLGTSGTDWFCSELVVAALQHARLLLSINAASVAPGDVYRALFDDAQVRASLDPQHAVRAQQRRSVVRAILTDTTPEAQRERARRAAIIGGTGPSSSAAALQGMSRR